MSRPADWSALDRGSDPIPGDPAAVRAGGNAYVDVADAIDHAVRALRSMELDGDVSEATEVLITNAGEVADSVSRAEGRYRETGLALLDYAPRLAGAQETSLSALTLAETARDAAASAARNADRNTQLATGAEGDAAQDYADRARQYDQAGDDAAGDLQRALRQLQDAIDERDAAAGDAKDRIQACCEDGLNDSWWDNWGADLLTVITEIAEWVSTVAGILALCVCWIPVIGQAVAGVLLVIAGVAAVVAAIGNVILAATGERSWGEAILSIAVAALSVIGLGSAARAGGKLFAIARINRAAARQPLRAGETITFIPLRNANRYSVAQIRESETFWRSSVDDLAPSSPLYRLYGGPNSGKLGSSFSDVNPYTLDFPHNTLGLPADNTMQRMATFRIDPGAAPQLQRHALPYQGTLGGAPEYVFPRAGGVTEVADEAFRLP